MARITIEDTLYEGIKDYCELNGLNTNKFINSLIKDAFMKEKYGTAPPFFKKKEEPKEEPKVEEIKKEPPKEEPKKVEEPETQEDNSKTTYRIQYL